MKNDSKFEPMPRTAENAALGIGFERTLPEFKKGQKVQLWVAGRFWAAEVVRRCPGPVYWVKILDHPRAGQNCVLSCNNYGGVLDAD